MVGMLNYSKPARLLEGKELDDGWKVIEAVARPTNATGGNFSTTYIVEKEGKRAFMKAMDLSKALLSQDRRFALRDRYMRACAGNEARNVGRTTADKVQGNFQKETDNWYGRVSLFHRS